MIAYNMHINSDFERIIWLISSKKALPCFLLVTTIYFSKLLDQMDFLALSSVVVIALQTLSDILFSTGVVSL